MSRAYDDICAGECGGTNLHSLAIEHAARCLERKVPAYCIDTLRTLAEQQNNVKRGFSKTMDSRHLPQPDCGKAHAWDVVPIVEADGGKIKRLDWDAEDPAWEVIREEAEELGLTAGFLSKRTGKRWDLGHIQEGK